MKRLIPILLIFALTACSSSNDSPIVQQSDVEPYLQKQNFQKSTALNGVRENIGFWQDKLASDPGSDTYRQKLAAAYQQRFRITKNIADMQRADSLYQRVYKAETEQRVGVIQALAQQEIMKHNFKKAEGYSHAARKLGDEQYASMLLLFDSMIERGDVQLAGKMLEELKNPHSYSYHLRRARYEDKMGRLDSAISHMERVRELVGHSATLQSWAQSNLADMYAHDGRLKKAYQSYLSVLKGEQSAGGYLHSLEGIAWIAYAHDGNTSLAREILLFVDRQIGAPDVKLTLAELAAFEGHEQRRQKLVDMFIEEASLPAYGSMYNAPLINLYATERKDPNKAMALSMQETKNRPTPAIWSLRSLALLSAGDTLKARQVADRYVKGQTYEPLPIYRIGRVYHAAGMEEKARNHLHEALDAAFELGPVKAQAARQALEAMSAK